MSEVVRLKDFVSRTTCAACGTEMNLMQLFKPNSDWETETNGLTAGGFHSRCESCGAKVYKRRSDLVAVKLHKELGYGQATLENKLKLQKAKTVFPKSKRPRTEDQHGLVDVVASVQRFHNAREELAQVGQLLPPPPPSSYVGPTKNSARSLERTKRPQSSVAKIVAAEQATALRAVFLPQKSSSAEPVDASVQSNRGDDVVYDSWLSAFGVDGAVVDFLGTRRRGVEMPTNVPSGCWAAADHPELFPNVTTRNGAGDAGLERALLMSDHVKQFVPLLKNGVLVWRDDYDVCLTTATGVDSGVGSVPPPLSLSLSSSSHSPADPLRPVPAVLLQVVREHIQAALTDEELKCAAADFPLLAVQGGLGQGGVNDDDDDDDDDVDGYGNAQSGLNATLKRKGIESAVGRHVEAVADAAVTMVARCVTAQREAAKQADAEKIFGEPSSSNSSKAKSKAKAKDVSTRKTVNFHPATIGWRDVLSAVRAHARDLERQDKMSLRVSRCLPALRLTPQVVARFEGRVMALFASQAERHDPATVRRQEA